MTITMTAHERFKELREFKGLTQRDVARLVAVHPNTISNFETQGVEPRGGTMLRLMALLEVWEREFEEWKRRLGDPFE